MKKKLFAVTVSALLAFSVTACGTAAEQPQPVDDTPTIAEVAAEMEAATEETEAVETAAEIEAVVEEPEETETEVLVEETETEVAETETETERASNMDTYISDEIFDIETFVKDTGASDWGIGNETFSLFYGDWFIQAGDDSQYPDINFVIIGTWDGTNDLATYSYIFPSEDDIKVGGKIIVSTECVSHLQDIISSVKENGGPNVAPNAPGTEFYPCDPWDETIQTK